MRTAVVEPTLTLDLPAPGEAVTSPYYSLRLDAPEASFVAISIDGGRWVPCRFSAGYWWYEWTGYRPGRHVINAQTRASDGTIRSQLSRHVTVRLRGREEEEVDFA